MTKIDDGNKPPNPIRIKRIEKSQGTQDPPPKPFLEEILAAQEKSDKTTEDPLLPEEADSESRAPSMLDIDAMQAVADEYIPGAENTGPNLIERALERIRERQMEEALRREADRKKSTPPKESQER